MFLKYTEESLFTDSLTSSPRQARAAQNMPPVFYARLTGAHMRMIIDVTGVSGQQPLRGSLSFCFGLRRIRHRRASLIARTPNAIWATIGPVLILPNTGNIAVPTLRWRRATLRESKPWSSRGSSSCYRSTNENGKDGSPGRVKCISLAVLAHQFCREGSDMRRPKHRQSNGKERSDVARN